MNGRYLRELDPAELARAARAAARPRRARAGRRRIAQEKMQTLDDFWPLAGFLVERQPYDEKAWAKVMRDGAAERLAAAREALAARRARSTQEASRQALRGVVEQLEAKPREVFQPVRRGDQRAARSRRASSSRSPRWAATRRSRASTTRSPAPEDPSAERRAP